jgi:tetratricopeptide (TPR) repeat protein
MTMRPTRPPASPGTPNHWTSREAYLLALVCLTAGILVGYVFRGSEPPGAFAGAGMQAAGGAAGMPSAAGPAHSAEAVEPLARPLLATLAADPNNFDALVGLGNLYYDNHVYPEAIDYYGRALALEPADANVRTDRGTAYFYSGFPAEAVTEYEKTLAAEPDHAAALFNLGIVRLQGLGDPPGAVAAWERLLGAHPQHPERARIEGLIAEARSRTK